MLGPVDDFISNGSEYLDSKELKKLAAEIGATSLDDVFQFLNGKASQSAVQGGIGKGLNAVTFGTMPKTVGRFAGSAPMRTVARFVPGLATATAALGAADIVAGNDSFGNKVMDAGAMGLGGIAGGILGGGPLGVAIGSSLGKTASDATQAIFGGGKSAEERRMEEALLALRGGLI